MKRKSGYGKLCLFPVYFIESLHNMKRGVKEFIRLQDQKVWQQYLKKYNDYDQKMVRKFYDLSTDKIISGKAGLNDIIQFDQIGYIQRAVLNTITVAINIVNKIKIVEVGDTSTYTHGK